MTRQKRRAAKERGTPYRAKISSIQKAKLASSQRLPMIEKQIRLSSERAARLNHFAKLRAVSEDEIVAKALDILFNLAELLDERTEQRGWSFLSEESLEHLWNNDKDAVYDNWRGLYGVPAYG
ncbi:MAG: hypothetical protein HY327_09815 [Chloroflexi bacterium]|nr:hypothetical protein [Chloroflexota bacterium]